MLPAHRGWSKTASGSRPPHREKAPVVPDAAHTEVTSPAGFPAFLRHSIDLQSPGLFGNITGSRWQGQMGGRGTLLRIIQINMRKVIKPTAPAPSVGNGAGAGSRCRAGNRGGGLLERPRMGQIHTKTTLSEAKGMQVPSRETWHHQAEMPTRHRTGGGGCLRVTHGVCRKARK